jgi:hypothetical protein
MLQPHPCKTSADWLAPPEAIVWARKWDDVLAVLKADYPDGARVAVIPDATIQYFDVVATFFPVNA